MKQARWFILLALILIAGIAAFFIIRGIRNNKTDDPTVTETASNDTTDSLTSDGTMIQGVRTAGLSKWEELPSKK